MSSHQHDHDSVRRTCLRKQILYSLIAHHICLRKTLYTASAQQERQTEPECAIAGLGGNPIHVALSIAWPVRSRKAKTKILLPEAVQC